MTSAILVSIGAGIGLSPIWHQLIISAYAAWIILKIEFLGIYISVNQNTTIFIHKYEFENVICKMATTLFWL